MTKRKAKSTKKLETAAAKKAAERSWALRMMGGSDSEEWNNSLVNQVLQVLWLRTRDQAEIDRRAQAAIAALIGVAPKDELEAMMAAQLIAAHSAAMECYRRAMIPDQTFEGRRENLNQANKLSRTWTALLEALNRYRGKGQQKVTVEHVHVQAGGQAVSAPSRQRGEGSAGERRNNPMQRRPPRRLPMHLSPRCGAQTRRGTRCQCPAMPNGRCRMHGGKSPGAPKGNLNAFKHGRYTAEAIAERRELAALIRAMRRLSEELR